MRKWMTGFRRRIDGLFIQKQIHKDHEVFEKCVSCHVVTGTPKTLDISQRLYYIDGAGQMCRDCWDVLFPPKQETRYDLD